MEPLFISLIKFQFDITNEYDIDREDCENIRIKSQNFNDHSTYVVVVYRHPTNRHNYFIDALNNNISKMTNRKYKFYIVGDHNLNIASNCASTNIIYSTR